MKDNAGNGRDLPETKRREIGQVVNGSLTKGLLMKLNPSESIEDIRAGKFVVVEGDKNEYFSMITDVILETTSPDLCANPPDRDDDLMRQVLSGTTAFGKVELKPMLMLDKADLINTTEAELRPVKTIPGHFSSVYTATPTDVSRVFGEEGTDNKYFYIGTPIDMGDIPVCLNLQRFVERSNGIFGKSGTGKTFLTRIILCGIIRNNQASCLIFDM
ncbi:MAG: helicase HerA domain-containing protein, partial [Armatimonadota bacterium]